MTLHEAMRRVLLDARRGLSTREIAAAINRRRLYERGDGAPINASQVSARARRYAHLFDRTGATILLASSVDEVGSDIEDP